jgi:hypothetical protein
MRCRDRGSTLPSFEACVRRKVRSPMRIAAAEVHAADAFALGQGILVQEIVAGFVEHAQAVFRGS